MWSFFNMEMIGNEKTFYYKEKKKELWPWKGCKDSIKGKIVTQTSRCQFFKDFVLHLAFSFWKYISPVCILLYHSDLHQNKMTVSFLWGIDCAHSAHLTCLRDDSSTFSFLYFEPSEVKKSVTKTTNWMGRTLLSTFELRSAPSRGDS